MGFVRRRLTGFIIISIVFEVIALLSRIRAAAWVVDACIILLAMYLLVLAVQGWRRQKRIDLPPSMPGHVVRRRHWRLF
ncbi:hypothetical protein [Alicyclobacillus cellulosilyticus]|uniref:hypothetical protein n=1 Tax=Alicyclobacillus cellulosilyticus TaxID=1003997 RepID=UPI00166BADE7|nr:hypothetical protein [Alicyclobacillus cellulosilyticus]